VLVLLVCLKVVVGCMHKFFLLDKLSVLDLVDHLMCCILRQSYEKTLGEEV
jgi:hypothetical protein